MSEPTVQRVSPRLAVAFAIVVTVLIVLADVTTGLELNFAIFKTIPLIIIAGARSRRMLWVLCAFLIVASFGVFAYEIQGAPPQTHGTILILNADGRGEDAQGDGGVGATSRGRPAARNARWSDAYHAFPGSELLLCFG